MLGGREERRRSMDEGHMDRGLYGDLLGIEGGIWRPMQNRGSRRGPLKCVFLCPLCTLYSEGPLELL